MNIAIITGASSGIGKEFALQLDAGLYTIDEFWLIARRKDRLEELACDLDHMAKTFPLDLTQEADMEHLRDLLRKERPAVRSPRCFNRLRQEMPPFHIQPADKSLSSSCQGNPAYLDFESHETG